MKFSFVFPGQGSQSVGMLNAFADHPVVRATLEEASSALGQDLGRLIAEGPAEELNLTTNTQPVMLTAAVAIYRVWLDAGGPAPALVAGHSLGEYSALVAAGVIPFAQAVPLVRFRAQAMQEAAPSIPLVNNVDVAIVDDPQSIKDALVRQAAAPVRWVECVQKMAAEGVTHVIECGPGKVLAGLTKRIDGNLVGAAVYDPASLQEALALVKA
jgi:malonyl CoA-acyl carrier protein transacylase